MKKIFIFLVFGIFANFTVKGQDIVFSEKAPVSQVYSDTYEDQNLLPFNDLNIEFGYVLYQTEIETADDAELQFENVRDYAAIYVDGKLLGSVTDNRKKITLNVVSGKHTLQLYAENIGRITYGPEILDNQKGLFGSVTLKGNEIENWTMIPLDVKNRPVSELTFSNVVDELPGYYRGYFNVDTPNDAYLNISGWGMGEVWINGKYMGSYWEEEKQQSIQMSSDNLIKGKNEIIVFDLKNNQKNTMKISDEPIFK